MKSNPMTALLLILFLCLMVPVFQTSAALPPTSIGSGAALGDSSLTLEKMLTYSLQDEYLAKEEYSRIMDKFGSNRPFSNIIQAEDKHIAMLKPLFAKYNVSLPADGYGLSAPESLQAAYKAGVKAEQDNIAMYELFLRQDLPADVRAVFTALRDASKQHLTAFERNAG